MGGMEATSCFTDQKALAGDERRVAAIPCIVDGECERLESTARHLALQAERAAMAQLMTGIPAHTGGQLLLLRALHFFVRRMELLQAAAAVREADVNDPSRGLLESVLPAMSVGVHPLLLPVPSLETLSLGQGVGNCGSNGSTTDVHKVKFRPRHTYIFDASGNGTQVIVREVPSHLTTVEFPTDGRRCNDSGLGCIVVDGFREEAFIKEKHAELDGGGMPLLLRQVALEAATCAQLHSLDCFVKIRAVQVFEDHVLMLFRRLPGHSFDEFLDALELQGKRATESQILGGALLTLAAYSKLNTAGYSQRDAKSENLWLAVAENILKVVIIDSEACFKVGHIEDAHMDNVGNECWQLRALKDRQLWKFGGSTFSRAVTVFAANMDLQSKQCLPGEQSVVYSLSEIILRMMGEGKRVQVCSDDSRWEDVLAASVTCDLLSDDGSDDDSNDSASDGGAPKSSPAASPSSAYSTPFLHLVMTLRRRSFTQGGVDAFLDLGQALQLCRDFISEHLHSKESGCLADFAGLVIQTVTARQAAAAQPQQEGAQEPAQAGTGSQTRPKQAGGEEPAQVGAGADAGPEQPGSRQADAKMPVHQQPPWSELSHEELSEFHACPVTGRVEGKSGAAFVLSGIVLRRKQAAKPGPDVELFMKGPRLPAGAATPVCFASIEWWRRVPYVDVLVKQCPQDPSADTINLPETLRRALERAWQEPLRCHAEVLRLHLHLSAQCLHGLESAAGAVAMYPFTEELRGSVESALREEADRWGVAVRL